MGLHQSVRGKSYFKRRSLDNWISDGPEVGLHKSVWEKVTLIESVCNFDILSRSVLENVILRHEEGVLTQGV